MEKRVQNICSLLESMLFSLENLKLPFNTAPKTKPFFRCLKDLLQKSNSFDYNSFEYSQKNKFDSSIVEIVSSNNKNIKTA